ncbi:MAG: rhomboid family intramembrane serine protease [Flavobacteriaceae bacterium]|nr:rhomboid family intramembrane serine protease [Flavobacteriaceae bacterium]
MMRLTETVKHLIIINVIFFIASQIPNLHDTLYTKLSLFYIQNPNFGIWQYITSMFMHGSIMHLLFNMLALASFGSALEYLWGRNKFLLFYFATGIGAGILYTLVHYFQFTQGYNQLISFGLTHADILNIMNTGSYPASITNVVSTSQLHQMYGLFNAPAVGASGALYGVLVAFAFKYPDAELGFMFIPVPIKAKYFVPGLVSLDLIMGIFGQSIFGGYGTGVGHFAHIGGALTGYLLMLYFNKHQFRRWN